MANFRLGDYEFSRRQRSFTSAFGFLAIGLGIGALAALRNAGVELVILAGYLRLLSPWFVQQFPGKILNIHPSLLPAFPGLEAQRQALDYGVQFSGCTVHFVDEHLDHGTIILQKVVPVLPTDDEHSLAERILAQEHIAYSEAISLVSTGNYRIEGRRVLANAGNRPGKSHL